MKFVTTHLVDGVSKQLEFESHPAYGADADGVRNSFQTEKDRIEQYKNPLEIEYAEGLASEAILRKNPDFMFEDKQLAHEAIDQIKTQVLEIIKPLIEPVKISVRNVQTVGGDVYADVYGTHPTNFVRQRAEHGQNYWCIWLPEEMCYPGEPEQLGPYLGVSPAHYIQNLQRLLDEATVTECKKASEAYSESCENYGG